MLKISRTTNFKRLLEPLHLKHVRLRNRLVKPAQRMGYAETDGSVSERSLGFYEAIAKGGVGAIIVEHAYVDFPLGVRGIQFSAAEDKFIPSLAELANVIHKHGCPAFQQISHVGPQHESKSSGMKAVGPSALGEDYMRKTFGRLYSLRPLTVFEIEDIVEKFVLAGERIQKAGFDGLEIHAAHNYLLACFLSRVWNKREDEYGCQTLENRTRFVVAILRAVRERLGQDFVIGIRINGAEFGAEGGITSQESIQIARALESAGADYIHVMADGYGDFSHMALPEQMFYPEPPKTMTEIFDKKNISLGLLVPFAAAVKEAVSVPVITVGRLDPMRGEAILRKGMADAIALGRRLIADPELPNKLIERRLNDIVPCIACGTCVECNVKGTPVICRVNPSVGKESESEIRPAKRRKRVVVVGGGPAGMEASRMASLRGHDVMLYEKETKLGGLLPLAALIKGSQVEDLSAFEKYLKTQVSKVGVKIELGKEFSEALNEKIKPDTIIFSVGGVPEFINIPGIDRRNVLTSEELYRRVKFFLWLLGPKIIRQLTRLWLPFGKRVAIIGGSIHGCQMAEFLLKRNRKVTILEQSSQLGEGIPELPYKKKLMSWFVKKNVVVFTEIKYMEIDDRGITFFTKQDQEQTIKVDTIVLAVKRMPNDEPLLGFKEKAAEVYLIGDAKQPGLIGDAIADGFQIGRTI